jgi:hypothetical protein
MPMKMQIFQEFKFTLTGYRLTTTIWFYNHFKESKKNRRNTDVLSSVKVKNENVFDRHEFGIDHS